MIGDEGGPPLFYIPEDVGNLALAPITDQQDNVVRSVQQQRADLRRFIENVDYLRENRGGYAVRTGDRTPFEGIIDLKFAVDLTGDMMGAGQRLSLTANVFNFSSLLGEVVGTDWGRRYIQVGSVSPVSFHDFENAEQEDLTPVYQSNLGTTDELVRRDLEDVFNVESGTQTYSSLYQVELGLKYTF